MEKSLDIFLHARKRSFPWMVAALLGLCCIAFCASFALKHQLAWPCLFLSITGLPCPTCGCTRALAALAELNFSSAVQFNPLVAGSLPLLFALPWMRLHSVRVPAILAGGALLLAANWLYLIFFLPR